MITEILWGNCPDTVQKAAQILQSGGLVGLPTETVYGLGADGLNPEAVEKIFLAKGRPQDNPLILHIGKPGDLVNLCVNIPQSAWKLAEAFWPGPLTMVLPVSDKIPKITTAGLDTVGVRCPAHDLTRAIIEATGKPIAAPSANRSGKPSTTTAEHVRVDMDGRIDAIVDGGDCAVGVESTIVDLTGAKPRLLRPGGVTPAQLVAVLGDLEVDKAVLGQIDQDEIVRAPGMKYKHYAPDATVLIVDGDRESAAEYVRNHYKKSNAVLCFQEELELYEGFCPIAYGRLSQPETLAQGLFAALRDLDGKGYTTVYARCPQGDGVSYAVANRLKKAAAFTVVNLPKRKKIVLKPMTTV
ncbi:MAG: L-threonylcarbamoyladenylate synthase [Eubacteriales bacterium]